MKFKPLLLVVSFLLVFACISQAQKSEIKKGEIQEMVNEVGQLIRDHYVYPDIAERICDTLQYNLKKGEYDVSTYKALAEQLSGDLKSVNHDPHLNVWSIPPDQYKQNTERVDPINRQLHIIRENAARGFSFKKVEILEGNIGYLELTKFETIPAPRLERMLEGAMDYLSSCSALILDLRRNNGGNLLMVQRFMSYFFEGQVPITGQYTRESGGIRECSTLKNFHHRYLDAIPLFVLVSSKTVSGPEEVAYDLQVEERAVIIGEKTRGAGNPSYFYRIKEKLLVCIPYGYPVHPKTKSSWAGTGVTPDVMVPADSALSVAISMAEEAAEKVKKREKGRVDSLVIILKERLIRFESLVISNVPEAERLFGKTLDEFYQIEYMNKYLLFDLFDSYEEEGNVNACKIIGKQGILRYPDEDRFYSRLGNLYFREVDLEKALQIYSDLLKLNPNNVSVIKKIQEIHHDLQKSNHPILTGPYLGQKPPGMTPEIFAPGIVSTKDYREFSGTFTPDGTEYYFFRFTEGAGMMVTRLKNGVWTAPEPAEFNTQYIDNEPHITPDGKFMFFNSIRPYPGSRDERRPTQIWFMEREGTGWSEPNHLCEGMFATSTNDGTIYLNRGITKLVNGKLETIREIAGALNVPPDGWKRGNHSSIAPDESYMIYDSRSSDIEKDSEENLFICFRQADGTWSESFDLSAKLDLPGGEMLATITADGKYLFFCNRGDIYWVDAKIIACPEVLPAITLGKN